jgi:hypothetical protein
MKLFQTVVSARDFRMLKMRPVGQCCKAPYLSVCFHFTPLIIRP